MKRSPVAIGLALIMSVLMSGNACCDNKANKKTGRSTIAPAVAGMFYPADPRELKDEVSGYLSQATAKHLDGDIIGIISPHAGYKYSGQVAGSAFKQVEGMKFERVVVLGPSHHVPIDTVALTTAAGYRTPLGGIPIDAELISKLAAKYDWAKYDERPYSVEHSIEVELPFLQMTLKGFKLIPIVVGADDKETLDKIAAGLAESIPKEGTLFVASSDLSHYQPYDSAVKTDSKTVQTICNTSADDYFRSLVNQEISLCGASPVYVLKKIASDRNAKLNLVLYANSGDTAGDKSKVVGYSAIVITAPKEESLGQRQKDELLKLSRGTLDAYVNGKAIPELPNDPILKKDGAAFVTLKEHGELRGCIGQILAEGPLDVCVQQMTVAAAAHDPRFLPVTKSELPDIDIEISVLTKPSKLKDPMAVRVGTDGLIIEKDGRRGVLLPQVPTEQGWNKMQYLEGICHKAGLPPDAWKDANLMSFQAIVFGEKR
jgi:AmmeMemoRadiSam system protein B/AmmeMemoRadiSam system protein A